MEIKSEGLKGCESKNKSPKTRGIEKYSTTPIPKRIRTALKGDTGLNNSEVKIHNPFLEGISDLHDKHLYHSDRQNVCQILYLLFSFKKRHLPINNEEVNNKSNITEKEPYENLNLITGKMKRNKPRSFYTSNIEIYALNGLQKQKKDLLYVKLQDSIENGNMSD
ncbi:unnamed protein product, partial [Hymenolepis diminuta]